MDIGNLISGSSVFSKSSLNIWKFSVHVLLKTSLENFEHYFAGMWDECNCVIVWKFSFPSPRDLPTQGSNPGLPHCKRILYQLSHKESPRILEWVAFFFSRGSSHPGIEPRSPTLQADSYLTDMQSTSWETLGWIKHKLESRLPGEISITSDMQMIPV